MQNCPVTVEDVTITERIFGPDMSSLKGKLTQSMPKPMKKDLIEMPEEIHKKHHEIKLCIDTMFANECGMLTAVDHLIKFCSVAPVNAKKHDKHCRALNMIL